MSNDTKSSATETPEQIDQGKQPPQAGELDAEKLDAVSGGALLVNPGYAVNPNSSGPSSKGPGI